MSIKFTIKNTADKAVKEGDAFVRFSGTGEPFNRVCERSAKVTKTTLQGDPIEWVFTTGLDEDHVDFCPWFSEEEKSVVKASIKELKPKVAKAFGGEAILNPQNYSFWRNRPEVFKLKLSVDNLDTFFDTEKGDNALLYLSILSGAFVDLVAPNKDWAESNQIPHYLALETDLDLSGDEEITRSDAHGELALLRKEFGKEALFILAWCMQYDTNAFGALTYGIAERDLINYHIKYIDGKLVTKKKRNMPKTFLEYAAKWRGSQTRPLLFIEAYLNAGKYFNYITEREKKFVTADGTVLGNTMNDAVTNLSKQKFKVDLDNLRNYIENKWKE